MKIFLIVTGLILTVAVSMVLGVFLYLQYIMQHPVDSSDVSDSTTQSASVSREMPGDESTQPILSANIPLSSLPLSEGQLEAVRAANIDPDTFVITPQLQVCAAEKLGAERFAAIIDGDAPTFVESFSLLSCVK